MTRPKPVESRRETGEMSTSRGGLTQPRERRYSREEGEQCFTEGWDWAILCVDIASVANQLRNPIGSEKEAVLVKLVQSCCVKIRESLRRFTLPTLSRSSSSIKISYSSVRVVTSPEVTFLTPQAWSKQYYSAETSRFTGKTQKGWFEIPSIWKTEMDLQPKIPGKRKKKYTYNCGNPIYLKNGNGVAL